MTIETVRSDEAGDPSGREGAIHPLEFAQGGGAPAPHARMSFQSLDTVTLMHDESQSPGRAARRVDCASRRRPFRCRATELLLSGLLPATVMAQPAMPIDPEGNLQDLSQMKYCQWVLDHPDNRSRVYEYDTRRCQAALDAAWDNMAWMGEQARDRLATKAEQQARGIRGRTRDVTQVVAACRQACQKLTPDFDQSSSEPLPEPSPEPLSEPSPQPSTGPLPDPGTVATGAEHRTQGRPEQGPAAMVDQP